MKDIRLQSDNELSAFCVTRKAVKRNCLMF